MTLLDISPELRRPVVSCLALLLPRLPSPRIGPSYLLSAGTVHQVFGPCDVAAKVAMVGASMHQVWFAFLLKSTLRFGASTLAEPTRILIQLLSPRQPNDSGFVPKTPPKQAPLAAGLERTPKGSVRVPWTSH